MSNVVCSENKYNRQDAMAKIKNKRWYQDSSQEIQEKIDEIPEDFQGFLNDLADREEENGFYFIKKLKQIFWDDRYVVPTFEVKSKKDNSDYVNSFVAWRKGVHRSINSLVLVETQGEITHFIAKKSIRFATGREIYESIGSIHPPRDVDENSQEYMQYLQQEFEKTLRLPNLKISRLINLGNIYPDAGMTDTIVKLIAIKVETCDINEIKNYIDGNIYNDKRYDYGFEIIPIERLLKFLSETNDSFLLAIFGRLQALNVIKL
ncbi:MAG: hypothetical protein UU09_C0031G0011 [Microgenomates group bacterium GW2011_GWA2_40_6]|nr:MAG: hypothetical protein UU09_C0031G0011 [Microgenomates group bacterium GW2011_GWA2_40_6]